MTSHAELDELKKRIAYVVESRPLKFSLSGGGVNGGDGDEVFCEMEDAVLVSREDLKTLLGFVPEHLVSA